MIFSFAVDFVTQVMTQEVAAKQPQYDTVNSDGQYVLQLAHPVAVPKIQGKLDLLAKKWTELRKQMGMLMYMCMCTPSLT